MQIEIRIKYMLQYKCEVKNNFLRNYLLTIFQISGRMRSIKKWLRLCLVIGIIWGMSVQVFASNAAGDELVLIESQNNLDSYMDRQKEAVAAVESIYSHFTQNGNNTIIYPAEYAGEYLVDNQLNILLTDMSDSVMQKYRTWANYYDKLNFEQAQYSLNQLNSIRDSFDSLADDYALVSYGVDRQNNNVFVNVEPQDADALQNYLARTRSAYPVVISESEPIIATASLYGGDGIGIISGNSTASICIGGTYNGQNAVLTCGHGFNTKNTIYKGSSAIGKIALKRFGGWDGDFSIITLNSGYTPTNKVYSSSGTNSIKGCTYYPAAGTAIYKYGKTTGYAYGTINQVDVTVNVSDGFSEQATVKGLYGTSAHNNSGSTPIDSGDSGGPVYLKNGSSYNITGIISAKEKNQSGAYQTMYFSPIRTATGLGFSVKTN